MTMEEKKISFEITDVDVNESITQEHYTQMSLSTTVCVLVVEDGFEALGSFAPVSDPITLDECKKKARAEALSAVRKHLESIAKFRRAMYLMEERRKEDELKVGKEGSLLPPPEKPTDGNS